MMATLMQDLRYALRTLGRSPLFAVTTVITLAVGIGATTAVFSVVQSVVMSPLPYPDSDRLIDDISRIQMLRNSTGLPWPWR